MSNGKHPKHKDKQIMVRLDADQKQQLIAEAAKQRRTPSQLARMYIEDGLARSTSSSNT